MICKMAKDQKISVLWKLLFGSVTCWSFAAPVLSDSSKLTKTSCASEFSQQSTLPTSFKCKMVRLPDGTMLQTVPKLFSIPAVIAGKIPGEHIICSIPDCGRNLCKNGWCEDTMVGYNCHCSSGFQGRHCDEQSTELSTTDATTKPMTSPTTTMLDTTTYEETTTSTTPASQEDPTGVNYRGNLAHTINGHTCQAWTSQYPHEHDRTPANYPNAGLDDNYCRNPDFVDTAWCYTTHPEIRWEYCAVGYLEPRCQE